MKKHLLILAIASVMFWGCNSKEESKVQTIEKEAKNDVKKATKEPIGNNEKEAKETVKNVKEATKDAKNETINVVKNTTAKPKNKEANIVAKQENGLQIGKKLYKPCISCHGRKAEKKALKKSQIIANWSKEQIVEALQGYKNKSYGGTMKFIMQPLSSPLNKEQMEQIADYIVSMKK